MIFKEKRYLFEINFLRGYSKSIRRLDWICQNYRTRALRPCLWFLGSPGTPTALLGPGSTFSFFYRIPPTAGNEISAEISPNFANSERKENSNSKNEISVNSDRNFGDFDRKMMSVVIFVLFRWSNEKLLNTNFVQFFEIYNFCFRNFFIWAMVWKLFNYFKNYQLKVLSFHVTTSIFSLRSQLDFYYSCYCGYAY